jgi:hypothetical protein
MSTNGKPTTHRTNTYHDPFQGMAAQPLAKTQQMLDQVTAQFALMQKKMELQIQNAMGTVAVVNSAQPIVAQVIGNPNVHLESLTKVILERGVDICEDSIEIIIDDC